MPFSHHSHSGQFCLDHARNTLEEMITCAIAKSMQVFAVTEHMPRHEEDRYPEEVAWGWDYATFQTNQEQFFREASRLKDKYKSRIRILVGFESEWIRPESLELIELSLKSHAFDLFVGSVHHVHTKPIDYDQTGYDSAKVLAGGSDRELFTDYFDAQYDMLQAVRPPVVGHFDLIRLKSENESQKLGDWPDVWQRIERNLRLIVASGSLLEINFAGLRKGLSEPYPRGEISQVRDSWRMPQLTTQAFAAMGGKFCLSDDSHGIEQVGTNYDQCVPYLERNHISHVHFLAPLREASEEPWDERFPLVGLCALELHEFAQLPYWKLQD